MWAENVVVGTRCLALFVMRTNLPYAEYPKPLTSRHWSRRKMLKIVWNKSDCCLDYGDISIVAAPQSSPPFPCQAMVEEQDTHLLLGEQMRLRDPGKPAWYLANTLDTVKTHALGDVVVKGHPPHRLLAVVHDIEESPTLSPESVSLAYQNLLRLQQTLQLTSLAMPLLGTVHGKMRMQDSLLRLRTCLEQRPNSGLQRLWLMLPAGSDCACLSLLSH
jgi:hypothetical protein